MTVDTITDYAIEDGVAVITTDYPPVNALSHAVLGGLAAGLERAQVDPAVSAIVLACAGRTFHAGADIMAMGKPREWPELRDVQAIVERLSKPVVAAIHGTTLGGGAGIGAGCRCAHGGGNHPYRPARSQAGHCAGRRGNTASDPHSRAGPCARPDY